MRIVKTFALVALILASFSFVPQTATAGTSVAVGVSNFHHGYHGGFHSYYPYYRYRPFFYGLSGFYPYYGLGYGYGPGYGYGGYGYGPGYGYGYRPYGEVRTEIKPQNAQVFVDGGYVGKADNFDGWWQRLQLEPGRHRIVFRAPGFQPYVADVRVGFGNDVHLKYEMRPGNDQIAEQDMVLKQKEYSRRGYDRYRYDPRRQDPYQHNPYQRPDGRDGQYERRPPVPPDRDGDDQYDNDQDRDDSYYGNEGDRPDNRPDTYPDEQGDQRDNDRRPLVLHVEPNDATVYIDGNYYGTANDNGRGELQVLLTEGVHRVEVVRPGFETFSQQITTSRNKDNHVNIVLKKR